ncbi:MAG: class II aldolase, partial [Devosiaceae bacterium]|nr:class II aldolase [Devosiaceae bacterium MH13]
MASTNGAASPLPADFLQLSAACGKDPLRVQGPGGNTSFKLGTSLWIKASGTELADAMDEPIFVETDREVARQEALGAGDGTCRAAVVDPDAGLRPSIETTFHALIPWRVVVHTHSVATLVHAISDQGLDAARAKLEGLPYAVVPYRKPGRPLTDATGAVLTPQVQIYILSNHGLIVAGDSVDEVAALMEEVERRLSLPVLTETQMPAAAPPEGYTWSEASGLAQDPRVEALARAGSYYPDHVVFLGPGLASQPSADAPAYLVSGVGLALREEAKPAQAAMALCVYNVLSRLPPQWVPNPIGTAAEAELLNWDAEKYRQALAARA